MRYKKAARTAPDYQSYRGTMWTSLCLTILATGAVFAQPPTDCSELGFPGGSQPFSGSYIG